MKFKILFSLALALLYTNIHGQNLEIDSLKNSKDLKFKYSALILPSALIAYGAIGIKSDKLQDYNNDIKEELTQNGHSKLTIDDATQYVPFLSVYALNIAGVKGKNNFKDRTIILASAFVIMSSSVLVLKSTTHIERPDGSADNSFPSGHTATAFMGAEFLYQEYKDVSIWYGAGGYAVAAATGFLRMYNNKHWLTDVAAGAGIGMLSTKIAYWSYPFFRDKFCNHSKQSSVSAVLLPFYNGQQSGLNFSMAF